MRRAAPVCVALLLAAACSSDGDPVPTTTTASTTPTSVVDLTGVVLPAVGGATTTSIVEVGSAALIGTVRGPAGPVEGATVRIERLVGGGEVRHDVSTGPDGAWELRDVPGGRYRVRAFLPPLLAQTTAEVRFLEDAGEHSFDLVLEQQAGLLAKGGVAPAQPTPGAPVNLVVLVVQRSVDADGVVRSAPVSGVQVELVGLGRWVLPDDSSPDPADEPTTDDEISTTSTTRFGSTRRATAVLSAQGRARFELRCVSTGPPGLSLEIPVQSAPDPAAPGAPDSQTQVRLERLALSLPECATPPPPTSAPTTTSGSGSTSTTR